MAERTFESQAWAHDITRQGINRLEEANVRFGQQASQGVESFNRQRNIRADREQQQGQFEQELDFRQGEGEANRAQRGQQFDRSMGQDQQQFEQREARLGAEHADRVEAETKQFKLQNLRVELAKRQVANMEAGMAMELRELEHRQSVAERLAAIRDSDFQMDLLERQQAYLGNKYDMRHRMIADEASVMVGQGEEAITQWLQRDSVQRLLTDTQVGPLQEGAGEARGRQALATARAQRASESLAGLAQALARDEPDLAGQLTILKMQVDRGAVTPEDAERRADALFSAKQDAAIGAEPANPQQLEQALGKLPERAQDIYSRTTMQSLPLGSGSRLKLASWLDQNYEEIGMAYADLANPDRPTSPDDTDAIDRGIALLMRDLEYPGAPRHQAALQLIFGRSGPLRDKDWLEYQRATQMQSDQMKGYQPIDPSKMAETMRGR